MFQPGMADVKIRVGANNKCSLKKYVIGRKETIYLIESY